MFSWRTASSARYRQTLHRARLSCLLKNMGPCQDPLFLVSSFKDVCVCVCPGVHIGMDSSKMVRNLISCRGG